MHGRVHIPCTNYFAHMRSSSMRIEFTSKTGLAQARLCMDAPNPDSMLIEFGLSV